MLVPPCGYRFLRRVVGIGNVVVVVRRRSMSFIWSSFASAAARLIWRPSTSPSQPFASASLMRSRRLVMILASRSFWAGSGRRREQRIQACSCWQPLP